MKEIVLVYITNPTQEEARSVADHLLGNRLIACANIYSGVNSLYPWQGKRADETEVILIGKTLPELADCVEEEVKAIHSYTIPCVIRIQAAVNEDYFKWVTSEVAGRTGN